MAQMLGSWLNQPLDSSVGKSPVKERCPRRVLPTVIWTNFRIAQTRLNPKYLLSRNPDLAREFIAGLEATGNTRLRARKRARSGYLEARHDSAARLRQAADKPAVLVILR